MDPNDWTLTGNLGTNPATNFLGTTDNVPLVIQPDPAGKVGIGTKNPGTLLHVNGSLTVGNNDGSAPYRIAAGSSGGAYGAVGYGFNFTNTRDAYNYSVNDFASQMLFDQGGFRFRTAPSGSAGGAVTFTDAMTVQQSGNVRIDGNLGIGGGLGIEGPAATPNVETAEILRLTRPAVSAVKNSNSAGLFLGAFEPGINGRSRLDIKVSGLPGDSNGWGGRPDVSVMSLFGDGNVTIGDPTIRGARLQVEGGAYGITSRGSDVGIYTQNITVPGSKVFLATTEIAGDFYGNVVFRNDISVTGDVILTGADCAEEFDMAEAAEIEPGTVVVLDQDGVVHQSHQAYDKRVAGVISGAGDYRPGLILDRRQSHDSRVPVALVGKVYCKVDAQYAPIDVGDLLTTSLTPGHAMKADDPVKAFGSVIGKALRPLETGQGLVPILIALQ